MFSPLCLETRTIDSHQLYDFFRRTQDSISFSAVNETNLALKGIIGIAAMAEISGMIANSGDKSNFQVSEPCAYSPNLWHVSKILRLG